MPEFDHYVISGVLGEGGMGIVFRAEDRRTSLPVAIKVMSKSLDDPELQKRFMKENQILSSLNHRNIVRCYDVIQSREGLPSIVMEYLHGVDFGAFEGRPYPELLPLMIQSSMGLAYLKERSILHRDLSSNNVLVTLSNQRRLVKILDFGVAKLLQEGSTEELTRTGEFLGKLAYASPELLMMTGCDWRADIYSLGVIFYRLLTKDRPIKVDNARNYLSWLNAHQVDHEIDFAVPEGTLAVPDRLQRIIKRMLARNPEDRPQAYEEIIEELVKVQRRAQEDGLEPDAAITSSLPRHEGEPTPGSGSGGSGRRASDVPLVSMSPTPRPTSLPKSTTLTGAPTDMVMMPGDGSPNSPKPEDGVFMHSGGGFFQEMEALDLPKRPAADMSRHPVRSERPRTEKTGERTGERRGVTRRGPAVAPARRSKTLPILLSLVGVAGVGIAVWVFMGQPSPSAVASKLGASAPARTDLAPAVGMAPRPTVSLDERDIRFESRNLTQENLAGVTVSGVQVGSDKRVQLTLKFKSPVNVLGLNGGTVVHARTARGEPIAGLEGADAKKISEPNPEAASSVRFEISAPSPGALDHVELKIGDATLSSKVTRR